MDGTDSGSKITITDQPALLLCSSKKNQKSSQEKCGGGFAYVM